MFKASKQWLWKEQREEKDPCHRVIINNLRAKISRKTNLSVGAAKFNTSNKTTTIMNLQITRAPWNWSRAMRSTFRSKIVRWASRNDSITSSNLLREPSLTSKLQDKTNSLKITEGSILRISRVALFKNLNTCFAFFEFFNPTAHKVRFVKNWLCHKLTFSKLSFFQIIF